MHNLFDDIFNLMNILTHSTILLLSCNSEMKGGGVGWGGVLVVTIGEMSLGREFMYPL